MDSYRWGCIAPDRKTRLLLTNTKGEDIDPTEFKHVVASAFENKGIDKKLKKAGKNPDDLRVKFYEIIGERDGWVDENIGEFGEAIVFEESRHPSDPTDPDSTLGSDLERIYMITTYKAFGITQNDQGEVECYYFEYEESKGDIDILPSREKVSMRTVIMHSGEAIFETNLSKRQILDACNTHVC